MQSLLQGGRPDPLSSNQGVGEKRKFREASESCSAVREEPTFQVAKLVTGAVCGSLLWQLALDSNRLYFSDTQWADMG